MPEAMPAAASAAIAPSGNSAMTVTVPLAALSLPAVTPPNLRKSLALISAGLPVPTTIRRSALIPSGAGMSRADPLLPLNWLAVAARLTVLAAAPSAFRVAAPNFSASSQNTTRTPRDAAENGTKPTLTASDMGKSSRIQGCVQSRESPGRGPGYLNVRIGNGPKSLQDRRFPALWPVRRHTAKRRRGPKATSDELLTIS